MGRHFDSLDEVLEYPLIVPSTLFNFNIERFLREHIEKTNITEIPYHGAYLQAISGKKENDYNEFLSKYTQSLDESQFFKSEPTGIEDPESYVGLQKVSENIYVLTSCMNYDNRIIIESGVILNPRFNGEGIESQIRVLFYFLTMENTMFIGNSEYAAYDIANALTAYVEEAAYLDSLLE